MLDEDSTRFLVCKKMAQLVKLINHLDTEIATREFEINFITQQFDENLNSLIKKQEDEFNTLNQTIKQVEINSNTFLGPKYEEKYNEINSDYEKILVDCQSEITEITIFVSNSLTKIISLIKSIDNELENNLKQLDVDIEQSKQSYSDKIEKLNQTYKSELLTLDDEYKEKLSLLEKQTSHKLDSLDRGFNRSLNDLKIKFGQTAINEDLRKENNILVQRYKDDQISLKKFVSLRKEEMTFLISNTKAVLKEQILHKNRLFDNLKKVFQEQNDELNEAKKSYESNISLIESEYESYKNEVEKRQADLAQKLKDLQKDFVDLTKFDLQELQDQQLLFQLSVRKGEESTNAMLNDINQKMSEIESKLSEKQKEKDDIFKKLNQDIQFFLTQSNSKKEEFIKLKDVHQSEQLVLNQSQKSAIDDLISLQQREIDELKEKLSQNPEYVEINKEIEEKRKVFNSLCFEKLQLTNKNENEEDQEILQIQEKYDNELKKLNDELNGELETVINEEKVLIDACSESHRNEMFKINTEIAQRYDERLQSVRELFNKRNFKEEDEQINSEYEKKLQELEKQYEMMEKNDKPIEKSADDDKEKEEIESLLKTKKAECDRIEIEKKLILEDFIKQQKNEEDEYIRKMAEINYSLNQNDHSEYDEIRNKYNIRIQKLNIKIKELQESLNNFQNSIPFIEKVNNDFDFDEKRLRECLSEERAKSDIKISKTIHKAELKKTEILKKIENINTKFKKISTMAKKHTDQSSEVLKDATEKAQEESQNLQQKVADAISKLVKHYGKERDKMIKKYNKESEELKKSISEQKNILEKFVDESLKEEENSKANYDQEIQSNETQTGEELEKIKNEKDKKTLELEDQYNQILQKINQFKSDIENQKSRDEELQIIERLELRLNIKERHIKDLTDEISDCKKKIVQQEDVYNSHFGIQPSVAVFRPTTAVVPIPINLRLKQQQRPVSAAVPFRAKSPFIKNRLKNNDI